VTAQTTRAAVRSYVTRALRHPELADHDDIFEKGGASSLFAAELVLFVEDELGVTLDDDDLVRENFATIDALTRLVEDKLEQS
jgi:acyl carrier protein